MFAKYQYRGGATEKNIYEDIKKILTGTTDKNTLSADCVTGDTDILATVPAGWTADTGGLVAPVKVVMPVQGRWNARPVTQGTTTLWPVLNSSFVMRSTDNGATWTPITLPVALGDFNPSYDCVNNLAYGGGVWVLTDSSAAKSYVLISTDDGLTWTQATTTTQQQWGCPVWNGSLWVITSLQASTQAIVTSATGTTWTYNGAALPVASYWGTPVWNGSLWVVTQGNCVAVLSATALATSTTGTTWTSRTIPSYNGWTPQWNGSVWLICTHHLIATASSVLSSADGITWTARVLSISAYWRQPIWNGAIWVMSSYGAAGSYLLSSEDGVVWVTRHNSTSYLNVLAWLDALAMWVAFPSSAMSNCLTSTDGLTWVQRSLPVALNTIAIVEVGGIAFAFTNSVAYLMSTNGTAWTQQTIPYALTLSAVVAPNFYKNDTTIYTYSTTANTDSVTMLRQGVNNGVIKALNADGVSYKKVLLDCASQVALVSAEDFGTNSVTNLVSASLRDDYAQQLDLTNGGALYIMASARYIAILSYKPSGAVYGSSLGNGFTGDFEYSRDDGWNVGTGAEPYPTDAWVNGYLAATNWYVPRIKSNNTQDVYDANAYLLPFITNPFPKLVMNAAGAATPPAMELRICNFTSLQYGVLGGVLLGGIKLSANAYGTTGDEVQIGGVNYFVIACASSGSAAGMRLLVPKQ